MNKKVFVTIVFCVTLITISLTSVFADSSDAIINNVYVQNNDDEYSQIEEVYEQETEYIIQTAIDLNNLDNAFCKDIADLNFHRLYLTHPNISYYDEFQKNGSLKSIISDYYYMESLVYDESGNAVSAFRIRKMPYYDDLINMGYEFKEETAQMIREKEGKVILASQVLNIPIEWYEVINDPDQLKKLVSKQMKGEEILDIIIIRVNAYHMYLVLVEGASNEYGIPITYREDFLNLKNGKIYEMEDIVNSWSSYYEGETVGGTEAVGINGIVYKSNNEIIIALVIFLFLVGTSVVIMLRRKKSQTK